MRQGKGTFVATHAEKQVQFRFLKLVLDSGARGSEGPAQRDIVECRMAPVPVLISPEHWHCGRGHPGPAGSSSAEFWRCTHHSEDIWLLGCTVQRLDCGTSGQLPGSDVCFV